MTATVRDYDGMIAAIRARIAELEITYETIDNIAGLQSGYTAKIMAPVPIKNLGPMSMGALLGAIGLKFEPVVDEAAMARVHTRHATRQKPLHGATKQAVVITKIGRKKWRRLQSRGGKNRAKVLSKIRRIRIARKAARARAKSLTPARRREIALMGGKAYLAKHKPCTSPTT